MRSVAIIHSHIEVSAVIAAACMAAGLCAGPSALRAVRQHPAPPLADVQTMGTERQLDGAYPSRGAAAGRRLSTRCSSTASAPWPRAVSKAGDLAHRARRRRWPCWRRKPSAREARGHHELAVTMGQQVERMRRQIDYHPRTRAPPHRAPRLARAARSSRRRRGCRAHAPAHPRRPGHRDRRCTSAPITACRGQREDLDEMLGNLLDNACKWARSRVAVDHRAVGAAVVVVTVDDDGPGLEPSMRERGPAARRAGG